VRLEGDVSKTMVIREGEKGPPGMAPIVLLAARTVLSTDIYRGISS
jgi:hypothetical protein